MGMNEVIGEYEQLSTGTAKYITEYFETPPDATDRERVDRLNRCDRALKVGSTYGRLVASRANTGAVALAAIKMLGEKTGDVDEGAVKGIWDYLTPGASAQVESKPRKALAK